MLSGVPLDAATGVLQVTIYSARNLKGSKIGGGTPDPYVSLSINNRLPLARTKFKESTYNPHWGTTHFLLLNDSNMSETLTLSVSDHNEHRKDTDMGVASFELHSLLDDASQENIVRDVLKDGKERGQLNFDV
jgi:Ca2+-dependent lipid-binding protein